MSSVTPLSFIVLLFLIIPPYPILAAGLNTTVSEGQKNITAAAGQNVSLPCRVSNISPIQMVKWSRTDLQPNYILIFNAQQLDPVFVHPFYKERVDLQDRQMKDGDVSLILDDLKTEDTGTYECGVTQKETQGKNKNSFKAGLVQRVHLVVSPSDGGTDGRNKAGSIRLAAVLLLFPFGLLSVIITS